MKLTVVPVKIAKSTTLLITSPVERALRAQTAGWLLRREKRADRVVFAAWEGDPPRLETVDDTASIDGAMALTAWLALDSGVPQGESRDFPLSLSGGLTLPCSVTPVHTCCLVTVTMPRAEITADPLPNTNITLPLVRFPGAACFIVPAGAVQRTAAPKLLQRRATALHVPFPSLLFWNKGARSFDPLIWDAAAGGPVWRQSSAAGAGALGAYLSGALGQSLSLHQPGGVMAVTRTDEGLITVTAPAEVGRQRTVELVF